MLKKWIPLVSLILIACQSQPQIENIEEVAIIPQPASLTLGEGYFVISDNTKLLLSGETSEIEPVVKYFNSVLEGSSGFTLAATNSTDKDIPTNGILLELKQGDKVFETIDAYSIDGRKSAKRNSSSNTCRFD